MESSRYTWKWTDIGRALMIMVIGNIFTLIMGLPEGQMPSWMQIKVNLIMSLKFGIIPYLIKNFFTDDVKVAQKTIEQAATNKSQSDLPKVLIFVIIAALFLSGCYTQKRAIYQTHKALVKYPAVVAKVARDAFPCIVTKLDTTIISHDTTLLIDCPDYSGNTAGDYSDPIHDTIKVLTTNIKTKLVKVPVTLPVQTRYIIRSIEDSAKIKLLTVERDKAIIRAEDTEANAATNKKWKFYFLIAFLISAGVNLLQFKKFL